MNKWVAFCPCCRKYETEEEHTKRCALGKAKDTISDLLEAIERHRLDVWGSGEVKNEHDVELYSVQNKIRRK
jgi:hypothetical protein